MTNNNFYDKPFDDETLIKLVLFRKYIREWLPVFLISGRNDYIQDVFICDFFAGKGHDSLETSGSSMIILEEVLRFYKQYPEKASPKRFNVVFNDQNKDYIEHLQLFSTQLCEQIRLLHSNTKVYFCNAPFEECWKKTRTRVGQKNTASLLIMDQFGINQITKGVFNEIIQIKLSDVLFFIASSIFKRFPDQKGVKGILPYSSDAIKQVSHTHIHRQVCDFYRSMVPDNIKCYLSPFSIERGANVNGIIFGSHSLRGIDKFLNVAWKVDKHTGEANFNIDGDTAYGSQQSLFEELNKPKKLSGFQASLLEYIRQSSPTNKELYVYCLESGFAIKIMKRFLDEWKKASMINIVPLNDNVQRSFYLTWDNYHEALPKVKIEVNHE